MLNGIKKYINNFTKEAKKNLQDYKNIKTVYKQIPNMLTSFRALAPIPINILFFSGNIIGSLVLSGIAFLTDAIDGPYARKHNIVTKFGADLDAICDKLLIGGIAIPVIVQNPFMLINVLLEGAISITNIKAEVDNKKPHSSKLGKLKTWILSLTVLSGYIPAFLNISPNLLTSLLMTLPALGFQTATFMQYYKLNNKEKKEIAPILFEKKDMYKENEKIKKAENDKTSKKEIDRRRKIIELEQLKKELTQEHETKQENTVQKRISKRK